MYFIRRVPVTSINPNIAEEEIILYDNTYLHIRFFTQTQTTIQISKKGKKLSATIENIYICVYFSK